MNAERMNPEQAASTVIPDFAKWIEILSTPLTRSTHTLPGRLRADARRSMLDAAREYTLGLADTSGLEVNPREADSSQIQDIDAERQRVIMTGHQPVIFHPGLAYKYRVTEQAAMAGGAVAIAVVIDTDEGRSGAFSYPELDRLVTEAHAIPHLVSQTRTLSRESTSSSAGLYANEWLADASILSGVEENVCRALQDCGLSECESRFRTVIGDYRRIADRGPCQMSRANIAVRRAAGIGRRMFEIPFSELCRQRAVMVLIADVLNRCDEYLTVHNSAIERFRAVEGIRNAANPFPNLGGGEGRIELPLWLIDWRNEGSRRPVYATRHADQILLETDSEVVCECRRPVDVDELLNNIPDESQLIPRGALITGIMRTLFADLFVHGTGGGKYDRFTDELIRDWWGVEPTPIAVASTTMRLFEGPRNEVARLTTIEQQQRDLMYNPQRSFGKSIFSQQLETVLQKLVAEKNQLSEQVRVARESGNSAKEIGTRMQRLTDEIRGAVQAEFDPQLRELKSLTESQRAVLDSRTWPWFFFDWNPLG
ncbi:MAG: hypothetical protein JNL58_10405 [Planctomyces sp.]|nr:hypothetical protein [Planctomyces sp.]